MKAKKVLLIMPNYRRVYKYVSEEATMVEPPLGLAYIASYLRKNKVSVAILDAAALDLDYEQIKNYVDKFNPDIIGITSTTIIIEEAYRIAKAIKNEKRMIIVGGPHPSILPKKTLEECDEIDISAIGEGEEIMLELANGKKLEKIRGITYRKGKKIISNKCRELIKILDSLPFPARDLLPLDKYYTIGTRKSPNATLVTSRGCPYNCNFCVNRNVLGKGFRARSVENVVAEIDELVKKYGVKEIDIIDDNFTLIPERAERICDELIKRKYDLIWKLGNGVRADKINETLIKKMKQARCYSIAFGIETGNPEILKNINKGETLEDIEKAVKLAKKYKILTTGFFIIGNLGDNEKTMQQTIDFAKKLDLDIAQFQVFIPIPGSDYTKIIEKEGKILASSWSDYGAFKKPIFIHGSLTPELMERMQKKAYHDYYLRPRMIIRKLLEIRTFKQLKAYIQAGIAVLKFR
ncbi:radical SAM protein [Candidatus Pacearchaeota archaeon]|nr:radical SAM protein [Candidatus Pacearchaeota archaeon]